jgi:hypothetical protein
LALLPPSYDHLVTTILYGKETLELEEVIEALLSHETRRKPVNNQVESKGFHHLKRWKVEVE